MESNATEESRPFVPSEGSPVKSERSSRGRRTLENRKSREEVALIEEETAIEQRLFDIVEDHREDEEESKASTQKGDIAAIEMPSPAPREA